MRRLVLTSLLAGCFAPDSESATTVNDYEDDDLPSGVCRDTATDTDPCDTEGTTIGDTDGDRSTSSGTGEAAGDQCQASSECMGGFCAAGFDPETLQRAPKACQFACVPNLDDTLWCSDDASCCDANAKCTQRGYCVP